MGKYWIGLFGWLECCWVKYVYDDCVVYELKLVVIMRGSLWLLRLGVMRVFIFDWCNLRVMYCCWCYIVRFGGGVGWEILGCLRWLKRLWLVFYWGLRCFVIKDLLRIEVVDGDFEFYGLFIRWNDEFEFVSLKFVNCDEFFWCGYSFWVGVMLCWIGGSCFFEENEERWWSWCLNIWLRIVFLGNIIFIR